MSVINKDLGVVTAYAYAVEAGYTGTEEEFEQALGDLAELVTDFENFTVEVTTLEPGSPATASYANGVLSLGIPEGEKGDTGTTPNLTIGTVTTLAPGSDATATITGTAEAPVLSLGIPEGDPGEVPAAALASDFSASVSYKKGDYVWKSGTLYEFTADHAAGAWTGSDATPAKVADDVADLKSAFDEFPSGSYPDMTVGGVMSVDGGTEDQVPYTFRASGGGVAVGNREIDEIVGGTVAWNQLAGNGATPGTTERNGLTFTINADGSIDVSGTASASTNFNVGTAVGGHANHKRLIIGCPAGGSAYTYNLKDGYGTNRDTGLGTIDSVSLDSSIAQISIASGTAISGTLKFKPQIFDLTAMFGPTIADYIYSLEQANAGAGVVWFKRLFPNDYYAYDAGELKSVEGVSAHVTRGFNQWDEVWELGDINSTTGDDSSSSNRWRSVHYIPILPDTRYYVSSPSGGSYGIRARFYDANKNYVGNSVTSGSASVGSVFVTPINASYMRFAPNNDDIPNHDICINLSDPARNGEYEPYKTYTYPLDSTITLRGIPKLDAANQLYYDGDRYSSDGTVTRRYGIVDLGTLNWSYNSERSLHQVSLSTMRTGFGANDSLPLLCAKYVTAYRSGYTYISDKQIGTGTAGGVSTTVLYVNDSAYTDAATFKTAMSGVYLVYELATPTTETADPYTNPQIVDNLGTEEYVTTGIVPVGHYTIYPTDIVAKVDGLPSDFSTLIAPTETGFKASRAYSVNQFLIVNNQLYKVTASIASGATITPGTNVTAVTVADILTALLNA